MASKMCNNILTLNFSIPKYLVLKKENNKTYYEVVVIMFVKPCEVGVRKRTKHKTVVDPSDRPVTDG